MNKNNEISYIEFPTKDLESTKGFFASVFDWSFTDCGPEYTVVTNAGVNAGFYKSEQNASVSHGSVLVVIYAKELMSMQSRITKAGGTIIKPTFSFPGGYRFHFADPCCNEYGVWSETNA